eukprot:TRINITY_DN1869_c0_g1_i1.p1 TRINITY_DN1869_c0_g1~~TRINITY_DN1869_c0_g1_i1.p1  ORF type:complete len:295 (+),score=34.62 TRINITY_DN1869_c0_g1_i1:205-1089(+)
MAPQIPLDVKRNDFEQSELLRQEGNNYFRKGRFAAAIEAYTQAITLCPSVSSYWTNRALCHRKLNNWEKVQSDCRKALRLESNSVKAHYMLGLALLQQKTYTDGIKHLEKALEQGRGTNPPYMVEEIWHELAKAKYLKWESSSTLALQKQEELRFICERALHKECVKSSEPGFDVCSPMETDESVEETESENTLKEWLEILHRVFNKAAENDTPSEVPEHLCCNITLEIFRDPVITPSGITYERAALMEHLRKIGNFDPVTREPLQAEQLVPNLAIKEAVQAFLDKHGWAYKVT